MSEPPSEEIKELAREVYDALNRGDREGFVALIHPDVEFHVLIAEPEGGTFHGHDGVREWWDKVAGAFTDLQFEPEKIFDFGGRGFVQLLVKGTLGGVEVPQRMWQAFVLRNGKPIWWASYRTEAEARAALHERAD